MKTIQDRQTLISNIEKFFSNNFNINNTKFEMIGEFFSWDSNDTDEEMIVFEVFSGNVESLIFNKLIRLFEEFNLQIIETEEDGVILA